MIDDRIDPDPETPEQIANEEGAEQHERLLKKIERTLKSLRPVGSPLVTIDSELDDENDYEEATVRVMLLPCDDMLGVLANVLRNVADAIEAHSERSRP